MNILFIADPNSIHDIRWINFFSEKKEFSCFILPRVSHYLSYNNSYNVTTSSLHHRVVLLPPVTAPSTIRPLRNLRQILTIRSVVKKFRIDLLHVLYAEPNALLANGKWLLNIPMVLTTRGTDVLRTIPEFFAKKDLLSLAVAFQYKRALRNFDQITCTSQSQADALAALGILQPVSIIRTGVDFKRIEGACAEVNSIGIEKPYVLMPRNMKPIYNHEFTLDAIALLNDEIKMRYAFVFINSAGKDDAYFRNIFNKSKDVDADIRFLSPMDHHKILLLFKEASLVVMNPKSDGSPVTAMEAMACKRPLIVPPLAYDLEIFGEVCFFKDWSAVSLKEEIEKLLDMEPSERERRGERNFKTIFTKGNSEIEMRKVEAIYNTLIRT